MKNVRTIIGIVIAVASILTVANANGQTAGLSETTIDFGCVEIGDQGSDMVTVTNISSDDIIVSASIPSGPSSFSTDWEGFAFLSPGSSVDVNVYFDPTSFVEVSDTLVIDVIPEFLPLETAEVELIGTGGHSDDPCDLVQCILDFFNNAVANGTLEGTGNHPYRRVRAMRNRLRAIRFLTCHGYFSYAAYINQTAILRSDGEPCPTDFVQGSDLQAFNDQLELLQILLE